MHRSSLLKAAITALALVGAALAAGCSDGDGDGGTQPPVRELNSGSFGPGQTYAHNFSAPGAHTYHCSFHSSMTGLVTVSDAAPAGDTSMTVNITSFAFTPTTTTVRTGGNVYWVNAHNTNHTVTSD